MKIAIKLTDAQGNISREMWTMIHLLNYIRRAIKDHQLVTIEGCGAVEAIKYSTAYGGV